MTRACHRQHWRDMLWPGNFLLGVEALHTLVEALQTCWINAARTKRSPIGSAALSWRALPSESPRCCHSMIIHWRVPAKASTRVHALVTDHLVRQKGPSGFYRFSSAKNLKGGVQGPAAGNSASRWFTRAPTTWALEPQRSLWTLAARPQCPSRHRGALAGPGRAWQGQLLYHFWKQSSSCPSQTRCKIIDFPPQCPHYPWKWGSGRLSKPPTLNLSGNHCPPSDDSDLKHYLFECVLLTRPE